MESGGILPPHPNWQNYAGDIATNISVHDNRLISYCVTSDTQEIRMHTVHADREPNEYTDVVFSGVAAYHFEQDNFGTILFDISEVDIAAIYASNREQFAVGQSYGWPGTWNTSEGAALEYFVSHSIKGFVVSSSYGMHGWVLARDMNRVTVE